MTVGAVLFLMARGAKAKPFYKPHDNAPHLAGSPLFWRGAGGEAARTANGEKKRNLFFWTKTVMTNRNQSQASVKYNLSSKA